MEMDLLQMNELLWVANPQQRGGTDYKSAPAGQLG